MKCDKRTVTCDIGTAQYEERTIKCEKNKNKGTTKCDKSIVTYNIGTAQYETETVNCEKKKKEKENHQM